MSAPATTFESFRPALSVHSYRMLGSLSAKARAASCIANRVITEP